MTKKALFFGVAVALTSLMSIASPAQATTPDLFIVDQSGVLYSVSTVDGSAAEVGSSALGVTVGGGLNPQDNNVYAVLGDCSVASLTTTSPVMSTPVGSISGTFGGYSIDYCDSATIDGSGHLFATLANLNGDYYLVKYSLSDDSTVVLGSSALAERMPSLWFTPADGALHGMLNATWNVADINLTSGAITDTGMTLPINAYGVVVDDEGRYWENSWQEVWSGPTSNYSGTRVGIYGNGANSVSFIFTTTNYWNPVPKPTPDLPTTGQSTATLVGVGVLGFILVAGGLALVIRRNRKTS